MPEEDFHKDMFKAKRKPLSEIWEGESFYAAEIARFSPSACNSQPWRVKNENGELIVSRFRKPGRIGIMPRAYVAFYNRIDMGIYLFILETCLEKDGTAFEASYFLEDAAEDVRMALTAKYKLK